MANTIPKFDTAVTGTKSVEDLIAQVQSRIDSIHTTEQEQSAYLSSDDKAELDKMEELLQGSLSLLEQYQKTGGAGVGTTTDASGGMDLSNINSINLKPEWNGQFDTESDDSGEYNEVIKPYNQGSTTDNALMFKADDTMQSITGKNVGDDIAITVTYKDGSPDKSFLLKGMASSKVPLWIMADQNTQDITIDMSHVKRVNATDPKSMLILGGSGNDILIGSQGNDLISGGAGEDLIYGLGGRNALGGGAGTDEIHGGSGLDTISGGDGYDTTYTAAGDNTDGETKETVPTTSVSQDNFNGTGWAAEEQDNQLSISPTTDNTDKTGEINLTVPDDTMVYGTKDGDDLVLTYQTTTDGIPEDPKIVRINGVLKTGSHTKINIISESTDGNPGIIDLGSVNTQFNQVTITQGAGNDLIVAPKTALEGFGATPDQVGKSSIDPQTAKNINAAMEKNDKGSITHWASVPSGTDPKGFWAKDPEVKGSDIYLYPKDGTETLDLNGPDVAKDSGIDGYTYKGAIADYTSTPGEIVVTMFLKKDGAVEGTPDERIVLHIKNGDGKLKTVTVDNGPINDKVTAVELIGNGNPDSAGLLVGSKETTVFTNKGSNKVIDS